MKGPQDYRSFTTLLRAAGAALVRDTAGHEQWRLPNGRMFTIPYSRGAWAAQRPLFRWQDLRRAYPAIVAVWETL